MAAKKTDLPSKAAEIKHDQQNPKSPACGDCFFWRQRSHMAENVLGECHRYPPDGPVKEITCIGPILYYRVTRVGDDCGEFKQK